MSESEAPRPTAGRRRPRALPRALRPSTWTLRARVLGVVASLILGASVIVGAGSVYTIDTYLCSKLDRELRVAAEATTGQDVDGDGRLPSTSKTKSLTGHHDGLTDDDGTYGQGINQRGLSVGALVLQAQGDIVVTDQTQIIDDYGLTQELTSAQQSVLLDVAVDGDVHEVDLPGLGAYRVVAVSAGTTQWVIGLPMTSVQGTVYRLALGIAVVSLGVILLALAVGSVVIRIALSPLHRVTLTAQRVARLPLGSGDTVLSERVPEAATDAHTEVGQVGLALNAMLDHIGAALRARQASEDRVRRFVSDASHELRTPLASIRGYAELAGRTREPVPADVTHALSRVQSEADRMTRLVEDLLLLARLDERRALEREDVDLTAALIDAVSDAHAAGPAHQWRLDLPDEPVVIVGDRGRLHQVMANLLANARTHTPAGTVVTAAVHVDPRAGEAVLQVRDTGPGIAPEQQGEIFERFARGDTSRTRAAGADGAGTGLGLAIVSSVVAAHGGRVSVESRPGETVFTVRLPGVVHAEPEPRPEPGPEPEPDEHPDSAEGARLA